MPKYKLYQVSNEDGDRYFVIIDDDHGNIDDYLEYGDKVETDCWLSDILNCEPEDIIIGVHR